jgi:hypothetical protein
MGMVLAMAVMGVVMSALAAALVTTRTLPSTGTINVVTPSPSPSPPSASVAIGVYSDSGCQKALSSITWGTLNPGSSATSTIYLRNEGSVNAALNVAATGWSPSSASNYLTLVWNLPSNYALQTGQIVQAVLTLMSLSSTSGFTSFSFNVTITATQQ